MTWELAMAIVLIAIALGFDFTNGFHDSSNAIATSVSTRAISLKVALIMAASLNFVGAYIGAITGAKVASTIQDVVPNIPTGAPALALIGGALIGAIGWNLLTWYFGIPSSSTPARSSSCNSRLGPQPGLTRRISNTTASTSGGI
jgi:PiT family inorganic phosphate transporter